MILPSEYSIHEVSGLDCAATIRRWNDLDATWPPLSEVHLTKGFWWLVTNSTEWVAFAGLVPFEPFPGVGYLKRAYVLPAHRGHGLQLRLLVTREHKARELGWRLLVSECAAGNVHSARNFERAGFSQCEPEQRWGAPGSLYFSKHLC